MNLNDFSKWLQYNKRVKNLRGSEYFPYPLYICVCVCVCVCVCMYTPWSVNSDWLADMY